MSITYRYDISAITKDRELIEGTEQTGIVGKQKAWDMAIAYFKTITPKPWRVCISPRAYKINGRLVEDVIRELESKSTQA